MVETLEAGEVGIISTPVSHTLLETTKRVSVVITKQDDGTFRMVEKPYKGQLSLQFPAAKVLENKTAKDAAYKALLKGDTIHNTLDPCGKFQFQDPITNEEMEVFVFLGKDQGYQQRPMLPVKLLRKDNILHSDQVTGLHKAAFQHYAKYAF